MNKTRWEDLEKAFKKEKDPKVATRMLAVHMVRVRNKNIIETAVDLRHDPQLRIGPSIPIILQMCAPKHATFV